MGGRRVDLYRAGGQRTVARCVRSTPVTLKRRSLERDSVLNYKDRFFS